MRNRFIVLIWILASSLHASILLDVGHLNVRLFGSAESLLVQRDDLNNLGVFPASLAGIPNNGFSAGYVRWFGLMDMTEISFGRNLKENGAIAVSLQYASLKDLVNYDVMGQELGVLRNSDLLLTAGYGKKLAYDMQWGVNLKYLHMNFDEEYKGDWLGCGASWLMNVLYGRSGGRALIVGAGLQDLNLLKAKVSTEYSEYPVSVYAGANYLFPVFPRGLLTAGTTLNFLSGKNLYLSTGFELNYRDFLFARAGLYLLKRDTDRAAFGIGVKQSIWGTCDLRADYALSFQDAGIVQFFQVGLSFPGGVAPDQEARRDSGSAPETERVGDDKTAQPAGDGPDPEKYSDPVPPAVQATPDTNVLTPQSLPAEGERTLIESPGVATTNTTVIESLILQTNVVFTTNRQGEPNPVMTNR